MTRPRTSAALPSRRRLIAAAAASLVAVLGASSCSASGTDAKEAGAGKGSATRTVTDIAGEVEVPAEPKRIVSVDFYSPATLVDLGVKPVGVVEGFDSDDPDLRPGRYHEALKDTPTIGMYYELNIEAVAQQNPDLIFAETRFLRKGELKRLQGIAPVVQLDAAGVGAWKERTLMIGAAIGKSAEIKKQAAVFDKKAEALKKKYADVLEDNKLAVLGYGQDQTTWGTYPAGHFYVPGLGRGRREVPPVHRGRAQGGGGLRQRMALAGADRQARQRRHDRLLLRGGGLREQDARREHRVEEPSRGEERHGLPQHPRLRRLLLRVGHREPGRTRRRPRPDQ
ncbi:ABC transporter substrate-binding protein [Streptomyces parvus]